MIQTNALKHADLGNWMRRSNRGRGWQRGEIHHAAVLSDHDVELVHRLRADGMTYLQVAEKMGVSKSTVAGICQYRRRALIA